MPCGLNRDAGSVDMDVEAIIGMVSPISKSSIALQTRSKGEKITKQSKDKLRSVFGKLLKSSGAARCANPRGSANRN